jgi:hypothetical protein
VQELARFACRKFANGIQRKASLRGTAVKDVRICGRRTKQIQSQPTLRRCKLHRSSFNSSERKLTSTECSPGTPKCAGGREIVITWKMDDRCAVLPRDFLGSVRRACIDDDDFIEQSRNAWQAFAQILPFVPDDHA